LKIFSPKEDISKVWWFLTSSAIPVQVFWDVMLCSVVAGQQQFGGHSCLHLQGGVVMEKMGRYRLGVQVGGRGQ